MQFLVNDRSIHGQFHNFETFAQAIQQVMTIRGHIRRYGCALYCHRGITHARVTDNAVMQQAVQHLEPNARRAWLSWLTQHGPHWEDDRFHSGDDYLEVGRDVVTDSAIGEAAVRISQGFLYELVSVQPSDWIFSPIDVRWTRDDETCETIPVPNHWDLASVTRVLANNPKPVMSWTDVEVRARQRCTRLTFSNDAFLPLQGHPFVNGAAERIRVLLDTLNRMKGGFQEDGSRSQDSQRLYQDHFTGDKAWFSDSSDREKAAFSRVLTFPHPDRPDKTLQCPWHGKVKTPQLRIHFSWPIRAGEPLYVLYVGPKITQR